MKPSTNTLTTAMTRWMIAPTAAKPMPMAPPNMPANNAEPMNPAIAAAPASGRT